MAVNRVECFMDASLIIFLNKIRVFVHRKLPFQIQKLQETSLNRQRQFSKTSGKMLCKLISNTKLIMIKKTNYSKLKQSDCVYILQPKGDHQGSKIPFTDFRWIGSYIVEKVLPNNIYLVRKVGNNKTQILHRMRLRQFTPRQPIPDTPVTPPEWQPDPEVIIKHDDLYAREWECEYDKPIFDSDCDNMVIPNSPEVRARFEQAVDETRRTPGTIQKDSSEILPHTHDIDDGTDTDHYMQPDADTSVEQIDPTPTNTRSSKYDLRHNPRPNCNNDYRY